MSIRKYSDWEAAARRSKSGKAVSDRFDMPLYAKARRKTELRSVEIIKPLFGDPYLVYAGTAIRVADHPVSARECDKVKQWRSY